MTKFFTAFIFTLLCKNISFAKGQATDWQLSFQEAASPLMAELVYTTLFWIITFITVLYLYYLHMSMLNLAQKITRNHQQQHTTH